MAQHVQTISRASVANGLCTATTCGVISNHCDTVRLKLIYIEGRNCCQPVPQAEETLNTLKFATRAKKVKITAMRNKINDDKSQIMMYQRKVHELQLQLQEVKAAQATTGTTAPSIAPPVSVDDMQVSARAAFCDITTELNQPSEGVEY